MTPQEIEQEIQTLERFQEWLNSFQKRSKKLAVARNGCGCPLYVFLASICPEKVVVGCDGISIGDGRLRHSRLSYEFTRWIDDGRSDNQPVSVSQAIEALKRAKQAVGGAA